jgi:hypothetical protein
MSPRKIMERFRKFPWVGDYVPGGGVEQFHIVPVEREILDYKPVLLPVGEDRNHDALFSEQLRLVGKRGENIARVSRVITPFRRFYIGPLRKREKLITYTGLVEEGSTVKDTLDPLCAEGDKVQFVLSCFHPTKAVIVYTIPGGLSFSEWVKRELVAPAKTVKTAGVTVPLTGEMSARMPLLAKVVAQTSSFQPVQSGPPLQSAQPV